MEAGAGQQYERVDDKEFNSIVEKNSLGTIVESEIGNGPPHWMTFTPEANPDSSFGPVSVPEGCYFAMGDNRDNSGDSRMYGSISRHSISGKVSHGGRGSP